MSFKSFYHLCKEHKIEIPIIQRDYAQGREKGKDEDDIKRIREELVRNIISTIKNESTLTLNFVYGKVDGKKFIPIDGQQRLTTLFLLHWYIFAKANRTFSMNYEADDKNSAALLYKTRKTTERFCEHLNKNPKLAENLETIEKQTWFSGAFKCDPSIKSMLTVLKTIAAEATNQDIDFEKAAQFLSADNCTLGFIYLDLDDFDDEDLYIKMNSRGKRLTDFEIFKAKLQDSCALSTICPKNEDLINYIGRFNNEYCDLFYQKNPNDFDGLMMSFVKNIIKCDHYVTAAKNGISAKKYRENYKNNIIAKMSGGLFFEKYIANPLTHEEDTSLSFLESYQKDAIIQSLKKMDEILSYLCSEEIEALLNSKRFKNSHNISLDTLIAAEEDLKDDALRYAVFEFVYFMKPKTEENMLAYSHWLRFVSNMIHNTNFRDAEIAVNVMSIFNKVIEHLHKHTDYTYQNVLDCIANVDLSDKFTQIKQKTEEQLKAKLMLKSPEWETTILDAESYFEDGQITFLLEISKDINGEFDLAKFKEYFQKSKMLFTEDKKSKTQDALLERALLALPDSSELKRGYLIREGSAGDYSLRYHEGFTKEMLNPISIEFIHTLLDKFDGLQDVSEFLQDIIDDADFTAVDELWKNVVILENLPNLLQQYNRIKEDNYSISEYMSFSQNNVVILLLHGKICSSNNIDLQTFLLFMKTKNNNNLKLKFITSTGIYNEDNKPLRYIEKETSDTTLRIGYNYNTQKFVNIDTDDEYTFDEALFLLDA